MKLKWQKKVNISRVVAKVIMAVLALYVGGFVLTMVGQVLDCTSSPFYKGLTLIGWTVDNSLTVVNSTVPTTCNTLDGLEAGTYTNIITSESGTGVLSVVGIIAIASIVVEFVQVSWN